MPCNCDYLEAQPLEIALSQVECLHDELDGKKRTKSDWAGYHKRAYNSANKVKADFRTALLCGRLKAVNVEDYSLEMQTWWRDHQEADRKRVAKEKAEAARLEEKERAEYERLRKKYGKRR